MKILDNPVWSALTTSQASFAEGSDLARRFPTDISTLAAFSKPMPESYEALADLVKPGEIAAASSLRWPVKECVCRAIRKSARCAPTRSTRVMATRVAELVKRIRERDEIPFLHVRSENNRAVNLYERLGFAGRLTFQLAVLSNQNK
jgi:imidazolonepropionase-like amidohydrolase